MFTEPTTSCQLVLGDVESTGVTKTALGPALMELSLQRGRQIDQWLCVDRGGFQGGSTEGRRETFESDRYVHCLSEGYKK